MSGEKPSLTIGRRRNMNGWNRKMLSIAMAAGERKHVTPDMLRDIIELFVYFSITTKDCHDVYADWETLGHDHHRGQPTSILTTTCGLTLNHTLPSILKLHFPVGNDAVLSAPSGEFMLLPH